MRTWWQNSGSDSGQRACGSRPVISRYRLLICSHISDEMVSRTERAFSRAASTQE